MTDRRFIAGAALASRPHRPPLRLTIAEGVALVRPAPKCDLPNLLSAVPRGDGHAVLVLPALGRGDPYTARLRTLLGELGYAAQPWGMGVNTGPRQRLLDGAAARLGEIAASHGPVSVVGFSMGGLFARWLALRMPAHVRQVMTVCSPIHDPARNFWLPLEPFLGLWGDHTVRQLAAEIARPLPVPCTVLYSRADGLVNWASCLDASCPDDCQEINGPHVLIACNPEAISMIAQRLARPAETLRAGAAPG